MLLLRIDKSERELHISRQKYLEIKNPVFQMRENRETPLLQAAIRIGAAFVVATVYLRHLLPVSDISFFITLCKSKPVQPLVPEA